MFRLRVRGSLALVFSVQVVRVWGFGVRSVGCRVEDSGFRALEMPRLRVLA